MALILKFSGMQKVMREMKNFPVDLSFAFQRGLKKAGSFLQGKSQSIVPVDTGNLRNTAFTRAQGHGWNTEVEVGYTAYYAIYVHEDLDARHQPGKQAKFLEEPARLHRQTMLQIVRDEAKKVIKK